MGGQPRHTARDYLQGLLSGIECKNRWNLAEHAGHAGPQAMQRLLRTARASTSDPARCAST
jgi:hypothetical protein